jgi:hypothetical protein
MWPPRRSRLASRFALGTGAALPAPTFHGPDDVSAEGIAELLEASLLDEDADAIDPRRAVAAVTDPDTLTRLPDTHPGKLRASAAEYRRHGQELLDVAKAWRELRAGTAGPASAPPV